MTKDSMTAALSPMQVRKEWAALMRKASGQSIGSEVALVGTFTLDPVTPYLGRELHRLTGKIPQIEMGPYDQILQTCFDWKNTLSARNDTIVLFWRIEDFLRSEMLNGLRAEDGGFDHAKTRIDELAAAVAHLRQEFSGSIIVTTPPFPHGPDLDIRNLANVTLAGSLHRQILQHWTEAIGQIKNIDFLDLDGLQRHAGISDSLDARKWYLYRQPFSEPFWQDIGMALASLIASQKIAPKKCVVLDCDNTLWGGIVGEDGIGGIAIGDDFPGSVYRDFQQQLLTLYSQGVMLALCSKNNEADVWEIFDNHDRMLLKREHISAHRINWQDKPSNIVEIADELNIGVDSMVFVDDSPIEITHVQEALPSVETIIVPQETAKFPAVFSSFRALDRLSVTSEDRMRNQMMTQERQRREIATKVVSKEDFILSLELKVEVFPVSASTVERVTQLINKTNQFNLTTRRCDLNEVNDMLQSDSELVLAMRVQDRFGDYGIVGVAIISFQKKHAHIDSFLMSCRVLGRNVEDCFLSAIASAAKERGATQITGSYIASAKNHQVANFYSDRGFCKQDNERWKAKLDDLALWPEHVRGGLITDASS